MCIADRIPASLAKSFTKQGTKDGAQHHLLFVFDRDGKDPANAVKFRFQPASFGNADALEQRATARYFYLQPKPPAAGGKRRVKKPVLPHQSPLSEAAGLPPCRVYLTPVTLRDLPDLKKIYVDNDLMEWVETGPYTREGQFEALAIRAMKWETRHIAALPSCWLVRAIKDDALIGIIGFYSFERDGLPWSKASHARVADPLHLSECD